MAVYREDADLRFLGRCENEDLDLLVSLITRDPRDNTLRWTETLSGSDNYRRFYPAHRNYWQEIAAEIQTFGASSIASVFRGGNQTEILHYVCGRKTTRSHGITAGDHHQSPADGRAVIGTGAVCRVSDL